MNGRQFVYYMHGLSKSYPGNRKVLENINLHARIVLCGLIVDLVLVPRALVWLDERKERIAEDVALQSDSAPL